MNNNIRFIITIYLYLIIKANEALKINKLSIPSYHVLNNDNQLLLLGCDYTNDDSKTGFVLKWYFNSIPIYQWIPSKPPYVFDDFKGRVDTTYQASDDNYKKYSTLAIAKPTPYDSGNYSCNVVTFASFDKKTAPLIIIDPESSMNLTISEDYDDQLVFVECLILKIYNILDIKMMIYNNGRESSISFEKYELDEINKYAAKINIQELSDQSIFTCLASFDEIDYEMRKTVIYREVKSSFDPEQVAKIFSRILHSYKQFIKFYFK